MMANKFDQINNHLVLEQYLKDNFQIEIDSNSNNNTCAIYFSSNSLYYPNTEGEFLNTVVKKDRYEWKSNKLNNVNKHIFIRDIYKQWYLEGINKNINSIEKLILFLLQETKGLDTICIGGSAGGFIASLIGCKIGASKVFTFNGQFELTSLLTSNENRNLNPILVKHENNTLINQYFNIKQHIKNSQTNIFYFTSLNSEWDNQQYKEIKNLKNVYPIQFVSNVHGIPFDLNDLETTLHLNIKKLKKLSKKNSITALQYSIYTRGLINTFFNRIHRKIKKHAQKD